MKEVAASKFKAQCLALLEDVRCTKSPLVITKRGIPVARLVPIEQPQDDFIGRLKGVFEVVGDLDADPAKNWESAF